MSGVPEVVKGGFEFSIAGAVLTVAAKGVTKVRFPHASTAGLYVVLDLTGRSYTFDTDSYPVDAGLGITTTVDWGNAMPHFVYLGNEDNTSANVFAFSTRDPRMVVTPAVGLIHDTTALGATADSQNHILSWKADDAGIAAKPCVCIGSHTVTWETDAAPVADVWELVALTTADGFGKFQEGTQFTMPVNQNGAIESTYFYVAGGDAADDVPKGATTQGIMYYWVHQDGTFDVIFSGWTGNCTNGDVAAALRIALPLASSAAAYPSAGNLVIIAAAHYTLSLNMQAGSPLGYIELNGSQVDANQFSNVLDNIYLDKAGIHAF